MRSRIATLLLLALAAWALFHFARGEDARVAPPSAGGPLYPGLEPAAVDFLSMSFRTGHVVDFERDVGGVWRITYPPEAKELAQREYVERVIENLALAVVIPVEAQGTRVDRKAVGLERSPYSVTFGIGGSRQTLRVGDMDAFGKGIYAIREGEDEVVLTTPNIRTMLEYFRGEDYVDKHLLRGLRGSLNHVRIERPDGVLLDAELVGGGWALHAPVLARGDDARISTLVHGLRFIQQVLVAAVAPDDDVLAQLGLPNPDQVARGDWAESTMIELSAPGEAPIHVFLERDWAAREDSMYAIREDLYKLLEVDRNEFNLLTNEPTFFRDRRVVSPVRERAHGFRVELSGGRPLLDIRRDSGARWTFLEPERLRGQPVDTFRLEGRSSLSEFLQRVDGLEARGFCDPPEGEPQAALVVLYDERGVTLNERIELFDLDADPLRARVSSRPGEGLLLPPSVRELLDTFSPDRLRDLLPLSIEASRWARLEVDLPGLDEPLGVQRADDGTWSGDDEWGRRFGLGRDLLGNFRGYAWVPVADEPEYTVAMRLLDSEGGLLARVRFRRPGVGEAQEALGVPVHLARIDGIDRAEMQVPVFWLERLEALARPQGREAMPTVPLSGG